MSTRKRRTRRSKPGDLNALKREVWAAIMTASDLLDADDPLIRLKATHAVGQAAGVFKNIYETCDLEQRLTDLEARVAKGGDDK